VKTKRLEIDRLLWRAGFGGLPSEIDALAPGGRVAAVDHLLAPPRGPAMGPGHASVDGKPLDPVNQYAQDVLWWLDRTVRARHPLIERMTLNWHDHFATSNNKVGDVKLMMAQYKTLRRHALGRFRDLARAMVFDHAMQIWLDLIDSTADAPNENFAREFFELFTLGANDGYTEHDIREAARAFTGFVFHYDTHKFGFDIKQHDGGVKRVLGHRGRFMPLDIVDIALSRRGHAPFLCQKLWSYFTPRPCPPATLREMVHAYGRSHTDVRPVLRIILTHPRLYADLNDPDQVKPPVVYLSGMLRRTGQMVTTDSWMWLLDQMGQVPFYPPNVGGWDQDLAWLSTATIRARFTAASYVLGDNAVKDGSIPESQTPDAALKAALAATGTPWMSHRTMEGLRRYAYAIVHHRTETWEVKHYWPERQRALRHMLLSCPDAQVC
jgi:uncharacterized protein (DUF1800 family)